MLKAKNTFVFVGKSTKCYIHFLVICNSKVRTNFKCYYPINQAMVQYILVLSFLSPGTGMLIDLFLITFCVLFLFI